MHPNGRTLLACEKFLRRFSRSILANLDRWDVCFRGIELRPIVPKYPGANGIKIRQGWGWISVSQDQIIGRVRSNRMAPPALSQLRLGICARRLRVRNVRFAPISPRIPNTRSFAIDPSGARTHWQAQQGMVRSTACAFAELRRDEKRPLCHDRMAAF